VLAPSRELATLFPTVPRRRRARPSPISLGFSVVIAAFVSYLVLYLFEGFSYIPLSLALLTAATVYLYRSRSLRRRLPAPHGDGRPDTIGARQMTRTGLLMIVGGLAAVVLPLATVFFMPVIFFVLYLALPLGIALAEILQFAWIARLEAKTGAEVYSITEATEVDGKDAIVKTAILTPKDQ
jgi:hypothetical protein